MFWLVLNCCSTANNQSVQVCFWRKTVKWAMTVFGCFCAVSSELWFVFKKQFRSLNTYLHRRLLKIAQKILKVTLVFEKSCKTWPVFRNQSWFRCFYSLLFGLLQYLGQNNCFDYFPVFVFDLMCCKVAIRLPLTQNSHCYVTFNYIWLYKIFVQYFILILLANHWRDIKHKATRGG